MGVFKVAVECTVVFEDFSAYFALKFAWLRRADGFFMGGWCSMRNRVKFTKNISYHKKASQNTMVSSFHL